MATMSPAHLSKTQLNSLSICGLQYRHGYIDKWKAPFPAKVAAGIGMHAAFARYLQAKKEGQPIPSVEDMKNVALAEWDRFGSRDGLVYEEAPNDQATLAHDVAQAINLFMEKIGPFVKPWGVEIHAPVTLKYPEFEQSVESYIDLIVDDEPKTVIDWKLTQRFEATKEARIDQVLYSLWHSSKFGVPNTVFKTIGFVRLKKGMEIREDSFTVTEQDRAWHIENVIYPSIKQKEAGIFPANTKSCSFCRFRSQCRGDIGI